jgi:hypothetical protein
MRALLAALLLTLLAPLGLAASDGETAQPASSPASGSAAPSGSAAAPAAAPAGIPPADTQPYWTVGVAAFTGEAMSPDNQYLLHSFPLSLRERLVSVRLHFFGAEERRGYQLALIRRAIRSQGAQLESLRRERDALFFQVGDPSELARKQADYDQRIRQGVEALDRLDALDPAEVKFPEKKEVRFASGSRDEVLLAAPGPAVLRAAQDQSVDLLIYGGFEQIQGYLYLQIHAVDASLEREVFSFTDAVDPEQLPSALSAAAEGLTRTLWGRDWASLVVQASPPEARIYVDGTLLGTGQARLDFVTPGEHGLLVELEGYVSQEQAVSVQPYSLAEFEVELEKLPESWIAVDSTPQGAALYKGSTWLGVTPLQVARPGSLARFLLRLADFRDAPLYLGPSSPAAVSVKLSPASLDPLARQKRDRDRFYTAFGIFALSLPFPIFSYGYVNDYMVGYQQAVSSGNLSEAQRLFDAGNAYYYAYLGTLGVSVGLAVNMVIQLIRYIRSADRKG